MTVFHGFSNKNELDTALTKSIVLDINKAIEAKGSAYLLFSGGSTPKGLFKKLASELLDWNQITIGLVDERIVAEDSEFSNAAMLKNLLINEIAGDKKPHFLPLVYRTDDDEMNLKTATEHLNLIGLPDVVVLGMGNDGHFASLFPGDPASEQSLRQITTDALLYTKAPQFPHSRISHSWAYLRQAGKLYLHITGNEKKDLIRNQHKGKLPIDTVLNDKEVSVEIFWAN
jgi:6-phosphogluconolactonase